MPRERLPTDALGPWISLNDVTFYDVKVERIDQKGHGLVAQKNLTAVEETFDVPNLMTIPHDLVLNTEAVEEYAKEDKNFRQLLDACGHKSPRHDILLFLLVQLILSSRTGHSSVGVSNPWTEYVKLLDDMVPVPTLWNENERQLLRGTSLEAALDAKMSALTREFDEMREKSSEIECWDVALWDSGLIHLVDWYILDAWYRSRVLELPISGPALVPCIDMANHSRQANAYYEENAKDEVVLLLRGGSKVSKGEEVTISYGSEKSAAEMLFNYGFIDTASTTQSLRLPLNPFPDDPLGKAKAHIFKHPKTAQIKEVDSKIEWESPFAYLLCVNEEDGLEFKIAQETDGSQQLNMFWQKEDVTDKTETFETLVADHPLRDIFRLRANMMVFERLQEQLERISTPLPYDDAIDELLAAGVDQLNFAHSQELRRIEKGVIERAIGALEDERTQLTELESVTAYLGSMGVAESGLDDEHASNGEEDEEDFS